MRLLYMCNSGQARMVTGALHAHADLATAFSGIACAHSINPKETLNVVTVLQGHLICWLESSETGCSPCFMGKLKPKSKTATRGLSVPCPAVHMIF